MLIKAANTITTNAPYTLLSNGEAAGAASLRVKNINGLSASWALQVGNTGEEQSEIVILGTATPAGTAGTITATTRFSHPTDTHVYSIKFDKIIFKRSTAGTAGTATALTNGTVTITPDQNFTFFDDTSGAVTYAYKAAYYNSVTSETSDDSDWLMPQGYSFYSKAKLIDRAKRKLLSANYIKDDQTLTDWANEWLEYMNNIAIDVNKDYGLGTTAVSFSGTTELGTITATDFKEVRRVWFTTNGSDYYRARKMSITDFVQQQTYSETNPWFYYSGDAVIGRKPSDSSGTALIHYYQIRPLLANDADELPVVMHAYTKTFTDYMLAQAYYLDKQKDMGDRYMNDAKQGAEKFRSEITPRSKQGPQTITLTDELDGDNSEFFI